jgi:GntR family transcriptional regulator
MNELQVAEDLEPAATAGEVPATLRSFASRPLTDRVREELARSIANGLFEGGWLPSEPELSERLSVSRGTVRSALRSLEEEGLITRQRGRGTRINSHVVRGLSLTRVVGMYDLIREAGYTPSIDTTAVSTGPATPVCVAHLECDSTTQVVFIDRLFRADVHPAIHIQEMIIRERLRTAITADDVPNSIFEFAESFCDQHVDHTVAEIIPTVADARIAKLLGLQVGDACLRLIETHYSPDGRPFIVSDIHLVDRYVRFIVVRHRF